jgi:hypothetical protein
VSTAEAQVSVGKEVAGSIVPTFCRALACKLEYTVACIALNLVRAPQFYWPDKSFSKLWEAVEEKNGRWLLSGKSPMNNHAPSYIDSRDAMGSF